MMKQMFKLVWNKKRTNALIIVEIFFSFLALFGVITTAVFYADNYRHPLGFSYQGVWNVQITAPASMNDITLPAQQESKSAEAERVRQLLLAVRDLPEVEAVGGIDQTPFQVGASNGDMEVNHRRVMSYFNSASEELDKALGIQMVRGRWFEPADNAANYLPVVISERLSREAFGFEDPVGKVLFKPEDGAWERRIVGVFTDFRQHGEFHSLGNYYFTRRPLSGPNVKMPNNLLVRLRPGVTAAFEEKLMMTLQSVDKTGSYKIEPLTKLRASHMKLVLAPLIAGGIVALFLILMVGLGMVGVLWQSVTRRSREIGLRRAVGSDGNGIYKQVLGELILVTSVGLALGAGIAIQFPLLGVFGFLSTQVYGIAIAASAASIYALALLAGLYPSWLATQVQPAEVLHYE